MVELFVVNVINKLIIGGIRIEENMIKPLKNWDKLPNGYTFLQKTTYSAAHLGIDKICPVWTEVYAPTNGKLENILIGNEGGLTAFFKDINGKLWRFLHLVKVEVGKGWTLKEGQTIAFTGNSGLLVGNTPHLHLDISINGKLDLDNLKNFIDPEKYIMIYKPNTVIYSKADKEYYWVKTDQKLLFIPHERLSLAVAMQVGTTIEESLKAQSTGNF